jgi:hypothetical protein
MNTRLFPWLGFFNWPLSGDVKQDINPVTSWMSPHMEFNFAGDREIESTIVSEVASYGKQLGILSEALLEISNGTKGDAVNRLKNLVDQVQAVKQRYDEGLEMKVKSVSR